MAAFMIALASTARIESVNQLAAAIESGPLSSVGFLSQGNYDAVASVLPKTVEQGGKLEVKIYADLEELEDAVISDEVLAGLSTSRPHNDNGFLTEFSAGLITMRAPMFAPIGGSIDSEQLREAIDAATVRAIAAGDYQRLETQYYQSNDFESTAAFTCGLDPSKFPFPKAASASGLLADVLSSKELRLGALGPSNWGYQGNYLLEDPPGFWPDYLNAIMSYFTAEYGDAIQVKRVWNSSSNGVMDSVLGGNAHMTEPYWTVSAWYNGRARSEHFELGCTVLGTESIIFTKGLIPAPTTPPAPPPPPPEGLATWAIAVIAIVSSAALIFLFVLGFIISREKAGAPVFTSISADPAVQKAPPA